ncbi:MAG: transketolase [Anaerolineae bacterium]|jgi:transketolase
MTQESAQHLRYLAAQMRLHIIDMMGAGKAHHFGGSLSATDMVTAIYFYAMRYDPSEPRWPDRDRFLMSKGHCVPAQYAALAMLGVLDTAELPGLKTLGCRLQGHPAMQLTPGIEGCTGSLGHGLSYANGMALAARVLASDYRVYCLLGDGETQEGQVWEAAMTAAQHRLSNLTAVIDRNRLKAMDAADTAKLMEPMAERWRSFGWRVREIDGHDMAAICDALDWARASDGPPSLLIAHTVKGKGIAFIENDPAYHNAILTEEQIAQARAAQEQLRQQLGQEAK